MLAEAFGYPFLFRTTRLQPIPARIISAGCIVFLSFIGHKLYSFSSDQDIHKSSAIK